MVSEVSGFKGWWKVSYLSSAASLESNTTEEPQEVLFTAMTFLQVNLEVGGFKSWWFQKLVVLKVGGR